jgi:hypothetical protein
MTTATYQALTEQEKREVRMFGVTETGMREAVESSATFKFSGPAMVAASMLIVMHKRWSATARMMATRWPTSWKTSVSC